MAALRRQLQALVGDDHVIVAAEAKRRFEIDWSGRFVGSTPFVVCPASTEEVAAVVAACADAGIALVPQGGNTGLVGGSVPLDDEVVLSLTRLGTLGPVEPISAQVTAGAGVTLEALKAHADAHGLGFGVDIGPRSRATVGGMIATNAGGLRFVRHGGMRQQVLGIEAVLADGSVLSHLNGLEKDNTGYDLAGLLCGSEGTLAVVTAARLRLVVPPRSPLVALIGFDTVASAVEALSSVRRIGSLEAAELLLANGLELAARYLGVDVPLRGDHGAALLVEWDQGEGDVSDRDVAFERLGGVTEVVTGQDLAARRRLWELRERQADAVAGLGPPPHKLDVTLPAPRLAEFVADIGPELLARTEVTHVVIWGHVADGNVHVNVVGPDPDDDRVDDVVFRRVADLGGSISAEHGIGTAKRRWLGLARTPVERRMFAAVKSAFDPKGILNPHVLVGSEPR